MSAWALPRPSAMASAKLAKITVRKSQMVMDQVKTDGWAIASKKVTTDTHQHHEHDRVADLHRRVQLGRTSRPGPGAGSGRRRGSGTRPHRAALLAGRRLVRLGGGHGHEKSFPWLVIRRTVRG